MGKKKKGKDKKGKKGKALLLDAAGNKRMSVILRSAMNKGVTVVERYYWDCNTVETTLMGCALVVCLAGIMFESMTGRMESEYYDGHRAFLTAGTIFIIVF